MFSSCVPKVHSHLFTTISPSLYNYHLHLHFLSPKPSLTRSKLLHTLKSTLSTTQSTIATPPFSHTHIETPDNKGTHIEISLEKLFIPPETDISSTDSVSFSTRVLKGSNIVLSKYARDAQVVEAEFVKSSTRTDDCPSDGLPEFAFVGRSNVGKSSLLNSLVQRKRLALTSKKPGKTQLINHFRINGSWYLVDLPGYGHCKIIHLLEPLDPRVSRDDITKALLKVVLTESRIIGIHAYVTSGLLIFDEAHWRKFRLQLHILSLDKNDFLIV